MRKPALILLAALLCLSSAAQEKKWAVVDISSCFLRAKPDYESSNESQCLMGTVLEITGSDRYWRRVNAPDYRDVWTTELGLAMMTEAEKDAYIAEPKWICTEMYSAIYEEPSSDSQRICDFTMGDLVRKTGTVPCYGWLKVKLPSDREGWVRSTCVQDFDSWAATRRATPEGIAAFAKRFVGTPYMWGGISVKHFDCSGLAKFVYMMNGIVLKRNAREQFYTGEEVPYDFDLMQPGDLLYYGTPAKGGKPASITHVAIYIGDAHIVHSSQLVRINSLRPGDPDYYEKQLVGVRRMIGHEGSTGIDRVSVKPWYF